MYIFGGYCEKRDEEFHKYSARENCWREIGFNANLVKKRNGHHSTVYGKKMFVFGGIGDFCVLNDMYSFHLAPSWEKTMHEAYPSSFRDKVFLWLLLNKRKKTTKALSLPKPIIFLIIGFLFRSIFGEL